MKHLILGFATLLFTTVSAQTVQSTNAKLKAPVKRYSMNGVASQNKAQACGADTNGYLMAKATGLQALNINSATSAGAVGQYFDAPQSLSISKVSCYLYKIDATNGITMNATIQIFAAGPDSLPIGSALKTTTVVVDTNFYGGNLNPMRKTGTFTTPFVTSSPYIVVVSNATGTPMGMIFSSWTANDGAQEWLADVKIGANWLRSYDVVIGPDDFDADGLIEPHVSYTLNTTFTVDNPCLSPSTLVNFTNGSSPIINNRMYNIAAFLGTPELSYNWNYGDASAAENIQNPTHLYPGTGPYTVTLTDTVYGWTSTCIEDTLRTLGVAATASYTQTAAGLTATFTNTSTSAVTYLWDFGDGSTSTLTNPSHTYASQGTYTVCLTSTGPCGSQTTCNPVTVSCANPTPLYTFSSAGSTVNFTNGSTAGSGVNYLWDFGDGNTSTLMSPSHTYAADGTYTVCLTVSDNCGADSTCQTVVVSNCVNPSAGFTSSGTSPTFNFSNTSSTTGTTTYAWDFGDGNTATSPNTSNTYTTNGTFTVELTVTDSCGTNSFTSTVTVSGIGIDELALVQVVVYPNPSNGLFSIAASSEMKSADITDLSGKLIYSGSLSGNEATINAESFANGTYFLTIRFADGMNRMVRLEVAN